MLVQKELKDCTNWELLQLLVPNIEERLAQAKLENPALLKVIQDRDMTSSGFRPFQHFGGGL